MSVQANLIQLDSGPGSVLPTLKGVGALQDDVQVTAPRPFPPTGTGQPVRSPYQQPMAPSPFPPSQAGQQRRTKPSGARRALSANRKKSAIRPWMVIVAIAVIAIVVTLIVAMSGPDVATQGK